MALNFPGIFLFGLSLIHATAADISLPLKVGAFNIQVFGVTKVGKADVLKILIKVARRYDIILIQEIRDVNGNSVKTFLENVNNDIICEDKRNYKYNMVISNAIGRSTSKEQYAFLYRNDVATVNKSYIYSDVNDDFEREPFIVHFVLQGIAVQDVVFVAIHVKPSDAAREVDKLVDVYDDVVWRLGISDVVIMGDLNAACSYVRDKDWKNIRLGSDRRFWWLIDDSQDTSVEGSRCAYDRFIAAGTKMLDSIIVNSPNTFDFQKAYNLNKTQASRVSDHFPIEFHIKGSGWRNVQEEIGYTLTIGLPGIKTRDVFKLTKDDAVYKLYKSSRGTAEVIFQKIANNVSHAIIILEELHGDFPKLFTDTQCQMTKYYLSKFQSVMNKFPYQVLNHYSRIYTKKQKKIAIQIIWDLKKLPKKAITCQISIKHII